MDSGLVPLRPKVRRRFYEPLVLFSALKNSGLDVDSSRRNQMQRPRDTEEERFYTFVDKLSHVCDTTKGGTTVTSVVVMVRGSTVLYVFGCNQISDSVLQKTEIFMRKLLSLIASPNDVENTEIRRKKEVHRHVLLFNRPRVERYLSHLKEYIEACIQASSHGKNETDRMLFQGLESFNDAIKDLELEGLDIKEYLKSCTVCLKAIKIFLSPSNGLSSFINDRARKGRIPGRRSDECWSELRHHISRLLAYEEATDIFLEAREEWPELFEEYEVMPLASSRAESNPLGSKSELAKNIIGRMTSDGGIFEDYQEISANLQKFQLDSRISSECGKLKTFLRPFVHCEVLVLHWVYAEARKHGIWFFKNMNYVGASKPTCRLCRYYFECHPSRIKVRESTGTLYTDWRVPDVYKAEGMKAINGRRDMMNSLTKKIREDAFAMMDRKSSPAKRHDSNTYSVASQVPTETQVDSSEGESTDIDDLDELLREQLSLESTPTLTRNNTEEPESDIEVGGAKL